MTTWHGHRGWAVTAAFVGVVALACVGILPAIAVVIFLVATAVVGFAVHMEE